MAKSSRTPSRPQGWVNLPAIIPAGLLADLDGMAVEAREVAVVVRDLCQRAQAALKGFDQAVKAHDAAESLAIDEVYDHLLDVSGANPLFDAIAQMGDDAYVITSSAPSLPEWAQA